MESCTISQFGVLNRHRSADDDADLYMASGAGKNLKVGALVRRESGGSDPAQRPEQNFLSFPSTFLALNIQLIVLVSAFVMVRLVWSVSFLLFFYSRCPRAQLLVKVGGHVPPCPMELAPL